MELKKQTNKELVAPYCLLNLYFGISILFELFLEMRLGNRALTRSSSTRWFSNKSHVEHERYQATAYNDNSEWHCGLVA